MNIIENKILDRRFTDLIRKALNAGYFKFEEDKDSIIGTPQGSIISPILSNIYLNKLDRYIEFLKSDFDTGVEPKLSSEYYPMDPSFKKLVYTRYANN